MHNYTRLALLPVCAISLALIACEDGTTDNDNAPPITQDDTATPGADAPGDPADPTVGQEVDDFRDRMALEIENLNRELETIDDRAADLGAETRQRYEDALAELRDRRDELEERIQQLEVSSRARWTEMRAEIEAAWTQLTDNIVAVRRELDDNPG